MARIPLRLAYPFAQRLRRAPELRRDRLQHRPLRDVGLPMLLNHPNGTLTYLRGKPTWTSHRPHPPKKWGLSETRYDSVANELVYRHDEPRLEVAELGRPWSFDGDGALFRLVSEAQRIRLAHLFDPVLAVHTSVVEPLPHQIRLGGGGLDESRSRNWRPLARTATANA